MNRYILLRDNKESGPFTLEEIRQKQLRSTDLIWVEHESHSWKYPQELKELVEFTSIAKSAPSKQRTESGRDRHIFVSLPSGFSSHRGSIGEEDLREGFSEPAGSEMASLYPEREDLIEARDAELLQKEIWSKRVMRDRHPMVNLALIFFGLLAGAGVFKKMVEQFSEPVEEPAIEASVASVPSEKPAVHEAITPVAPKPAAAPVTAMVSKPPVPVKQKPVVHSPKPVDLSRMVMVKSNDYSVGLFGGINNLQFTVFNNSPELIDKVIVAVDYLKPNGSIISSNEYALTFIRPYHSQKFTVPSSKRGVKVHYRIKTVIPQKQKAAMKNI